MAEMTPDDVKRLIDAAVDQTTLDVARQQLLTAWIQAAAAVAQAVGAIAAILISVKLAKDAAAREIAAEHAATLRADRAEVEARMRAEAAEAAALAREEAAALDEWRAPLTTLAIRLDQVISWAEGHAASLRSSTENATFIYTLRGAEVDAASAAAQRILRKDYEASVVAFVQALRKVLVSEQRLQGPREQVADDFTALADRLRDDRATIASMITAGPQDSASL